MTTAEPQHYLIHFAGELSVKGRRTRERFVNRLRSNLVDAYRSHGLEATTDRRWSRLYVRSEDPGVFEVCRRVFGVQSVARAVQRPWSSLEDLVEAGEEIFAPAVASKTFAVRLKRGERSNEIPFRSAELERQLGARLLNGSAGVRLKHPEVEARIELMGDRAFFFFDRRPGPGGLPMAAEGRALALVSGGFDSVVAAWRMMRRGVSLDYVFFNLGGDEHLRTMLAAVKVLADRWSYGTRPQIHLVDFRPVALELERRCPEPMRQVLLKRRMLQAAARVATEVRAQALVTGDAVAQVSSQTLSNLATIDAALGASSAEAALPVLRPLLAFTKEEIFEQARAIGTFEASSKVPEYCGLGGRAPAVSSKPAKAEGIEAELDPGRLKRRVEERAVIDLRALDLARLEAPGLGVERVPPGAQLLDLRRRSAFRSWRYRGALHRPYPEILDGAGDLDRGMTYCLYCEVGLKSAHAAQVLAGQGLDARHVLGGVKTLLKQDSAAQDPALAAALSPVLLDD